MKKNSVKSLPYTKYKGKLQIAQRYKWKSKTMRLMEEAEHLCDLGWGKVS